MNNYYCCLWRFWNNHICLLPTLKNKFDFHILLWKVRSFQKYFRYVYPALMSLIPGNAICCCCANYNWYCAFTSRWSHHTNRGAFGMRLIIAQPVYQQSIGGSKNNALLSDSWKIGKQSALEYKFSDTCQFIWYDEHVSVWYQHQIASSMWSNYPRLNRNNREVSIKFAIGKVLSKPLAIRS